MSDTRDRFIEEVKTLSNIELVIVVIQQSNGSLEVITTFQDITAKIAHYTDAYDEWFRLKTDTHIQIIEYLIV